MTYKSSSNFLNQLFDYERGSTNYLSFKSDFMKMKIQQLPRISRLYEFPSEVTENYCVNQSVIDESLLFVNNSFFSSRNFNNTYSSSNVNKISFIFNDQCSNSTDDNNPLSLLTTLWCTRIPSFNCSIIDFCDSSVNHEQHFFSLGYTKHYECIASLTKLKKTLPEKLWILQNRGLCCHINEFSRKIAFGCRKGFYLVDIETSSIHPEQSFLPGEPPGEDIIAELSDMNQSVLLSKEGLLLFIGSNRLGILALDTRESSLFGHWEKYGSYTFQKVLCTANGDGHEIGVKDMKLLDDRVSLVILDNSDKFKKIDLRMNRVVVEYLEDKIGCFPSSNMIEDNRKISLNEDLDLICSIGSDKCLRFWSLSSGKLLKSEEILSANGLHDTIHDVPRCFIVTKQRKFFVVIVHKDFFYVIHCQ